VYWDSNAALDFHPKSRVLRQPLEGVLDSLITRLYVC
jgi:hypothetical protein